MAYNVIKHLSVKIFNFNVVMRCIYKSESDYKISIFLSKIIPSFLIVYEIVAKQMNIHPFPHQLMDDSSKEF